MKYRNRMRMLAASLALVFAAVTAQAAMVKKMGLGELVGNADKVFRGTVLDVQPDTIFHGGGELPVVVYTLAVEDVIKGDFGSGKAAEVIELRMYGRLRPSLPENGVQRLGGLNMNPEMEIGAQYVLFTTQPSSIGLSTTVGLGQGLFKAQADMAGNAVYSNGFGNLGLFDGPVDYQTLDASVRATLR